MFWFGSRVEYNPTLQDKRKKVPTQVLLLSSAGTTGGVACSSQRNFYFSVSCLSTQIHCPTLSQDRFRCGSFLCQNKELICLGRHGSNPGHLIFPMCTDFRLQSRNLYVYRRLFEIVPRYECESEWCQFDLWVMIDFSVWWWYFKGESQFLSWVICFTN